MRFADPLMLSLLLLLFPVAVILRRRERGRPAFSLPLPDGGPPLPETLKVRLARWLPYLRLPALALLVLALARPQAVEREVRVKSPGTDLVVALDLSGSMLAVEARSAGRGGGDRLQTAKAVLKEFIRSRPGDRIGLIAFAGRPYPAAPLTQDHRWLNEVVDRLEVGAVEDGTSLGDAILSGVNRLRDRPAASRALILVTDGRSNAGAVSPEVAAAAAGALGVRVHAIGIGSSGKAVIPAPSPLGGTVYRRVDADLDQETLRKVAKGTGGRYFRADDAQVLARVFAEIDRLERTPAEESIFFSYAELYPGLAWSVLFLLAAELVAGQTWLRRGC